MCHWRFGVELSGMDAADGGVGVMVAVILLCCYNRTCIIPADLILRLPVVRKEILRSACQHTFRCQSNNVCSTPFMLNSHFTCQVCR